jgi:putative FmdB family regulatory protein
MPTYEYTCRDCGRNLEIVQSFADDPLETCEHCGGRLRKVFSAAGIIFKGSGYYVTDTRSEKGRAKTSSASDSSDGESSKTSSGSKDASSGSKDTSTNGTSSSKSDTAGSPSTAGSSSSDAKSA